MLLVTLLKGWLYIILPQNVWNFTEAAYGYNYVAIAAHPKMVLSIRLEVEVLVKTLLYQVFMNIKLEPVSITVFFP